MKNKFLFSFLILTFPFIAYSQNNHMISFDFGLAGSENYYFDDQFIDQSNTLNSLFSRTLVWNSSINYERSVKDFLILKLGLEVATHGYQEAELGLLRYPGDHDGNGGVIQRDELYKRYFTSLIVPLSMRLKYPKSKISPYVEIGVAPGFSFFSRVNSIQEFEMVWSNNWGIGKFLIFGNLACGVDYKATDKNIIYVQPHFQYELSGGGFGIPSNVYYYSIGLRLGTRYLL